MRGKSKLQNELLRYSIDQGHRCVVLTHLSGKLMIVQKIKGEVCWLRVQPKPRPHPVVISDPEYIIYDEAHHWPK